MNCDTLKMEVARMVNGVRADIRTAIERVNAFFYVVWVSLKIRYRKTKRAAKQIWHELWK